MKHNCSYATQLIPECKRSAKSLKIKHLESYAQFYYTPTLRKTGKVFLKPIYLYPRKNT